MKIRSKGAAAGDLEPVRSVSMAGPTTQIDAIQHACVSKIGASDLGVTRV